MEDYPYEMTNKKALLVLENMKANMGDIFTLEEIKAFDVAMAALILRVMEE